MSTFKRFNIATNQWDVLQAGTKGVSVSGVTSVDNQLIFSLDDGTSLNPLPIQSLVSDIVPVGVVQVFAGTTTPTGWLICDGSTFSATTYPLLAAAIGTTYGGTASNPALPNLKGKIPVGLDSSQTEFNTMGKTGGEKAHTLTTAEMPSHNHGGATGTMSANASHNHGGTTGWMDRNANHNHGRAYGATYGADGNHDHGFQVPNNVNKYASGSVSNALHNSIGNLSSQFRTTYGGAHQHSTYVDTGDANIDHLHGISSADINHTHSIGLDGSGNSHNNLQPYVVMKYIIRAA